MGSEEMGGVLQYQVGAGGSVSVWRAVEGVERRRERNYPTARSAVTAVTRVAAGSRERAVVAHLSTFQVRARVARRARRAHRSAHTCV